MPKTMYLTDGEYQRSGISITWTKSAKRLDISGWYDSYGGIEPTSMGLDVFFHRLGITQKDCLDAFKPKSSPGKPSSSG